MLGVVMTEVLEFVESHLGLVALEELLEEAGVAAVYTAAGAYSDSELEQILIRAARATEMNEGALLLEFGHVLLPKLLSMHPEFAPKPGRLFEFLSEVETHIHHAVTMYYPDAVTPSIKVSQIEDEIIVNYKSMRSLAPLVQGMLEEAAKLSGGEWTAARSEDAFELKGHGTFRLVRA